MSVKAEFYQTGDAYLLDNGTLMRAGVPRFEPGKFAGSRALRVEEGTTNLLTANQSNVETDTTGFAASGAPTSGVRSTAAKFEGVASFMVTCSATASSGYFVSVATSTQGTYIARLRMKGDGFTTYAANSFSYALRITYTDATLDQVSALATPDTTWQDLITISLLANVAKTVSMVNLYFISNGTALSGLAFFVDALQIEAQTEATTWHVGGGTRNTCRVLVPTLGLFDPTAGTVEAWVRVSATTEHHLVFDTRQIGDALSSTMHSLLRINAAGGALTYYYWNGGALRTLVGGNVTAGVWAYVACSWGPSGGKVYRDGALMASHADVPQLVRPPRLALGGRVDGGEMNSGLLMGGMRFTKGRARSDAEVLAAYNSNLQFTEDGADTTVFSFDGTMRSLLPANMAHVVSESALLIPATITATTTATNYVAINISNWEFPLLGHRTTATTATTLTFDFGAVVNFRAFFIALVNWEWCTLSTSYDGVTYTNVLNGTVSCAVDQADQYRKVGGVMSASGRYARVSIPAQVVDANAAFFETPLIVFTDDLDALAANPNWGMQMTIEHDYESGNAGGHDEVQARGKAYLKMQVRTQAARTQSAEWQQLMSLGNHRKFLFFANLGNPAESYLMRSDGSVQWEEQPGLNAISMTWREHIN